MTVLTNADRAAERGNRRGQVESSEHAAALFFRLRIAMFVVTGEDGAVGDERRIVLQSLGGASRFTIKRHRGSDQHAFL